MLVSTLLSKARARLATILDNAPLVEAAKRFRVGADMIVVCDSAGVLVGVITKMDVVRQISHCQGASCTAPISLVMTREVVQCHPEDRLHEVWTTMKQHQLKNVPVVDATSKPMGVLNARDALAVLLVEVENEEALLRDYIMGVGYR